MEYTRMTERVTKLMLRAVRSQRQKGQGERRFESSRGHKALKAGKWCNRHERNPTRKGDTSEST